ncbi:MULTISPECIES: lysozyme inhibitor LprI family protein [Pontibacillus]|uniref:DUF1311 domain-containing protein n=1 Tax=Pontibacillus chungwhensis TaxID=265426 RepID=A0ABY8UWD4_9BACI|nr:MULTISPECIES: lysozyme inhibitor LprI family protein [Pontibacillus]MCD5323349.1 DUF1311 domain-containing protein [Pontibacillus sp. HN14]WIF96730.1 DUF1311 domain-containing protein [Pontibacillus chungwhensis]
MRKHQTSTILALMILVLAACSNDSGAQSQDEPSNDTTIQTQNEEDGLETSDNTTSTDSNGTSDEETEEDEELESMKTKYLTELNKMNDADHMAEAKTTMVEMEKQEQARYEKWDKKLNEIYGVLEEQLSQEEMDQLREKQRKWIRYRDEAAKEASLKYEGGSTERLEYVATEASLTRERCFELVAHYM